MHLYNLWFVAIAVLWVGYFFLEGFDFGVGILTRVLAKSDTERRVLGAGTRQHLAGQHLELQRGRAQPGAELGEGSPVPESERIGR